MKQRQALLRCVVVGLMCAAAACRPATPGRPGANATPAPSAPPSSGTVDPQRVRAWPTDWSSLVGQEIVLEGTMGNAKRGALVLGPHDSIDIDGLDAWPSDMLGLVRVRGVVIERWDLPVFHDEGRPVRHGMPVPVKTDLEAARHRFLLTGVVWEPI